jgi:hypothetical protein
MRLSLLCRSMFQIRSEWKLSAHVLQGINMSNTNQNREFENFTSKKMTHTPSDVAKTRKTVTVPLPIRIPVRDEIWNQEIR